MSITKSQAAVDAWADIAQNTVREGATVDVSGNYDHILHIDMALSNATAHTGTEIIVQISSSTSTDEFWTNLVKFVGPTGTANEEAIDDDPLLATSTTITISSTTGYTTNGNWRFIKDGTIANSELVWQNGYTTDTNITILDGTTREHAVSTNMYSIADTYVIQVPSAATRVRVVYNNTYDADGATVATRCRISKVTAL